MCDKLLSQVLALHILVLVFTTVLLSHAVVSAAVEGAAVQTRYGDALKTTQPTR